MATAKKTQKKEKLNKKASKQTKAIQKSSPKTKKKSESKKIKSTSSVSTKSSTVKSSNPNQKFYDQLKLSESYVSLVLGAIVVIGVSALFLFYLRESRKPTVNKPEVLNSSVSPVLTKTPEQVGQRYTILENESLWDVAVKFYGDGFRYVEIIEANKLENPDYVPPGTVIIIPNAQ